MVAGLITHSVTRVALPLGIIDRSQYKDPAQDLCINWGYPSVFNCTPPDGGGPRLCMLYEAQTYPEHVV